jgi:hypothetical protein
MVEVLTAEFNSPTEYAVQMNDDGEFVYLAKDKDGVLVATFYDASGAALTAVDTSLTGLSRILVTSDGDFVLGYVNYEVYTSTGTLLGESNLGWLARIDGADSVYQALSVEILYDMVALYE